MVKVLTISTIRAAVMTRPMKIEHVVSLRSMFPLIPAQAGIQGQIRRSEHVAWVPAFAGRAEWSCGSL